WRDERIGKPMIDDQLAAAGSEGLEAAPRRIIDDGAQSLIDQRHVAVEVEALPVPVSAEHPFEQRAERRLFVDRLLEESPAEGVGHLASGQPAEIARLAFRGSRPRIEGAGRLDFTRRETGAGCPTLACEDSGI